MIGAVVTWVHARPWRPGWLLAAAAACSLVAPAAGGVAWLILGPLAMFVVGYDLWWLLRGWKRTAAVALALAPAVAGWAVFGLGLGGFTESLYALAGVAWTLALVGGCLWGRHREGQERGDL